MTVHLVRHGKAGHRHDDDPNDIRRHLSTAGRAQADAIAARLANQPIARIVSSSAERCTETVEPLAQKAAVDVERHLHLMEGTGIESAWSLLQSVAASLGPDEVAVLCSHGDIIPDLVRRAQSRGARIHGPTGWSKGSIWTLEHDGDQFTAATFHPAADT